MATVLRDWSYRYQWLYDSIAAIASIPVGGTARFRQIALEGLSIAPDDRVLDLCCGSGPVTRVLAERSRQVIGLDASPKAIRRAQSNVPTASFVQGWAQDLPFSEQEFDLIHVSAALHEMPPETLQKILNETYRILKPGGIFALVDFHRPKNPLFYPGLAAFLFLFETETSWQLLKTDLLASLDRIGFVSLNPAQSAQRLFAGGSLQVIQVKKSD